MSATALFIFAGVLFALVVTMALTGMVITAAKLSPRVTLALRALWPTLTIAATALLITREIVS